MVQFGVRQIMKIGNVPWYLVYRGQRVALSLAVAVAVAVAVNSVRRLTIGRSKQESKLLVRGLFATFCPVSSCSYDHSWN